jgi:hypothetical protein
MSQEMPIDPRRIALIGFGEVGQRFGQEFLATGELDNAIYDICPRTRCRASLPSLQILERASE